MNNNDLLGFGKILPLDKLIQSLEKIVGRVTKNYFDKKDIEAKSLEIQSLAMAKAAEMKIISAAVKENFDPNVGIEYNDGKLQIHSLPQDSPHNSNILPSCDLENRTKERILHQQAKKQINIESITSIAAEQLKEEPEIEDKPIDEDWLNRFFNIAEDISNSDLQTLWGKILAGEIKRSKSYSLRTLELIKNLSKEEADTIAKVANYAIRNNNGSFLFKGNQDSLAKYGVTYYDKALLIEIGILQPGDFTTYILHQNEAKDSIWFTYGNFVLLIERQENATKHNLSIIHFTKIGEEILNLLTIHSNLEYLKEIGTFLKRSDTQASYAYILDKNELNIRHTLPIPI